jgi:hypothetical protein
MVKPAALAIALATLPAMLAACEPPGRGTPTTRPAPPGQQLVLLDLVGGWRWLYRTEEQGTARVEDERWRLRPDPEHAMQLVGRYVRTVEVRSLDRAPFQCNERPWYRQRALYDVTVALADEGVRVVETGYTTEPSPCDHGFRHVGEYHGDVTGDRMALHWGPNASATGGTQTLWQIDSAVQPLPDAPWPSSYDPAGAWRWDGTSYDEAGNLRDESEWWQITRRSETRLDLTYRRRVTVRSPTGAAIACANAPTWSFDDAYVLDGQKEEEHWHFHELAVEPGDHPCLRATPKRNLDEATAEQLGDFFVLEWRGKRHQILYRPE